VSADARVARAIIEVRDQFDQSAIPIPGPLYRAISDLINEAKDALHLSDDDIEGYR
jgi:hypothetical protein